MADMDDLDRRLLAALRADGRAPVATLAATLGVSRSTVRARMARLETAGVIAGFTVRLGQPQQDAPVRAVAMLAVEGKAVERVIHALIGLPEVRAVHTTNGRWDVVVDLAALTLPDFDAALARMRQIPGVVASETSLLLASRLPRR